MQYSFNRLQVLFVMGPHASEVIQYGDCMTNLTIAIGKIRFGFGDRIMNGKDF
jgi:hypothetical protein